MYQQNPLPGCNFVIHTSPYHGSPTHKLHNDPYWAYHHQVKPIFSDGSIGKATTHFHTPFYGQLKLTDF